MNSYILLKVWLGVGLCCLFLKNHVLLSYVKHIHTKQPHRKIVKIPIKSGWQMQYNCDNTLIRNMTCVWPRIYLKLVFRANLNINSTNKQNRYCSIFSSPESSTLILSPGLSSPRSLPIVNCELFNSPFNKWRNWFDLF